MVEILKGVALPEKRTLAGGSTISEALKKMEINDCFVLPTWCKRGGVYQYAKMAGVKVTVRKQGDKILLWRTE